MELLIFNRLNSEGVKGGHQDRKISVTTYNGIRFTKRLLHDLNLEIGDRIYFARDKENVKKWYMGIAEKTDVTAFEIQRSQNSSAANGSRGLSRTILAGFNINVLHFLVSAEPEIIDGKKYYQLIPIEGEAANIYKKTSRKKK